MSSGLVNNLRIKDNKPFSNKFIEQNEFSAQKHDRCGAKCKVLRRKMILGVASQTFKLCVATMASGQMLRHKLESLRRRVEPDETLRRNVNLINHKRISLLWQQAPCERIHPQKLEF